MDARPRAIAEFEGVWALEKEIEDRLGEPASFRGAADVRRDAGAWRYEERGEMRLGSGETLAAERVYLWVQAAKGVAIAFADGRPFHEMPFAGGAAEHDCPPDLYRVRYDFSAWPDWTAIWEVQGPRKDYLMTAQYRRAPG